MVNGESTLEWTEWSECEPQCGNNRYRYKKVMCEADRVNRAVFYYKTYFNKCFKFIFNFLKEIAQ